MQRNRMPNKVASTIQEYPFTDVIAIQSDGVYFTMPTNKMFDVTIAVKQIQSNGIEVHQITDHQLNTDTQNYYRAIRE